MPLLLIFSFFCALFSISGDSAVYAVAANGIAMPDRYFASETVSKIEREPVYVGGMPIGIEVKSSGLIIIGKTDVVTEDGLINTAGESNIEKGDILFNVAGNTVNTTKELSDIINSEPVKGKRVVIELRRKNQIVKTSITSALDKTSKTYKTGLWVREETHGIGTVTFIKKNKRFASLGHPVVDADTRDIFPIREGKAFNANITGVMKGERGVPGELKGLLKKDGGAIGSIDKNNVFGIYGDFNYIITNPKYPDPIDIMPRSQVKPGKAEIISTISGTKPEVYQVEIVKTNFQAKAADRSLVIKVTDKTLLEKTGGIVQGMSGSPIIQGGKLVGAVTHVFVNDPTRGYGVYADWMINQ